MDTFHSQYRPLNDNEKMQIDEIKNTATKLLDAMLYEYHVAPFDEPGIARAKALAKTKLEEAVMWAVKAITM